jgi:hypothetical protein
MTIDFPELDAITASVSRLEKRLSHIEAKINSQQEWFDLKAACALKGLNYHTVSSRPKLQPNQGEADAVIAGRKRWRRETILRWLELTDEDLR